jgi:uncharacterized OB-fold protein
MSTQPTRPIPVPTPLTQPFWDAAKERRLVIQRCRKCRRYFHPPVQFCLNCFSEDLAFEPVSGRGRIHARTVMHDPRIRGFEESVPFAIVAVELDEMAGLLLVANLLGSTPEEARIGSRVEVDFEPIGDGFVLPQFRLSPDVKVSQA